MADTDVLAAALNLPPEDRARIAHELILSLEDEGVDGPAVVEREWAETIGRRVSEMESGEVKGVPADEAFAEIRSSFEARK